jgi:hypothetical protein
MFSRSLGRRIVTTGAALVLLSSGICSHAVAATTRSGSSCTAKQSGKSVTKGGKRLTCVKGSSGSYTWQAAPPPATAAPRGNKFPASYVGTVSLSSRPDSSFRFSATGTMRLELSGNSTPRFASYRLAEFNYTYTVTGKDTTGAEKTCSGTERQESVGETFAALSVVIDSKQVTPPSYYSLGIHGNIIVCDGVSIGRLVWPDDGDSVLTDRSYTYGKPLIGTATNPSRDLPWSWNLRPQ